MRIHTSDKFIAWSALLSGLTVSAVAIYYSVAGLVAIFSAAVIPIIVMGVALEISKLAGTVWLKQNWTRAPYFIRAYLLAAIAILMLITSMGIFGFLSKAHSDQSLVSGDVQSRIAIYDEKIKTAKDNIDANRKALKQMDEAVDQVMGRSSDEKGAEKAVAIRRAQQKERVRLQSEIASEQKTVAALSEERAPIAAEVRKVEAEVGPIKYIANFIYGDNPDANILEKAVTWVIIIIVVVFDPLAVILLLASQYSFQWFRKQEEDNDADDSPLGTVSEHTPIVAADEPQQPESELNPPHLQASENWPFPKVSDLNQMELFSTIEHRVSPYHPGYEDKETLPEALVAIFQEGQNRTEEEKKTGLEDWNQMIAEAEQAVVQEREQEDNEILESAPQNEKQAMQAWKHAHPDSSLKLQRKLLEKGVIDQLPWEDHLKPQADFDYAVAEAKKWAEENPHIEESEKAREWAEEKADPAKSVSWMEHDEQGNQIKKIKETYTQNEEQNDRTLWQRIQEKK
jgi:hypothetical protein